MKENRSEKTIGNRGNRNAGPSLARRPRGLKAQRGRLVVPAPLVRRARLERLAHQGLKARRESGALKARPGRQVRPARLERLAHQGLKARRENGALKAQRGRLVVPAPLVRRARLERLAHQGLKASQVCQGLKASQVCQGLKARQVNAGFKAHQGLKAHREWPQHKALRGRPAR